MADDARLEPIAPPPTAREGPRVTLGDILPPPPPENPTAMGIAPPAEPTLPTPTTEIDADLQRDGWRSRIGDGYGSRDARLRQPFG